MGNMMAGVLDMAVVGSGGVMGLGGRLVKVWLSLVIGVSAEPDQYNQDTRSNNNSNSFEK